MKLSTIIQMAPRNLINAEGKLPRLTGHDFKKRYHNAKFYKLTNKAELHNGLKYKKGLIIDPIPLNDASGCSPGGIYFCCKNNIIKWLDYSCAGYMQYYRPVEIPDDATVCVDYNKFKADKIVLGRRKRIWSDYDLCYDMVGYRGELLGSVDTRIQTHAMCERAIRNYSPAIAYVRKNLRTEKLIIYAIKRGFPVDRLDKKDVTPKILEVADAYVRKIKW